MKHIFRNSLILVIMFLYGCGTSPSETAMQGSSEPDVIFQGSAEKEVIQTLAINNCDGKSDLSRTEERSQAIEVTLSAEIAATIGASAEVITAEIEAAVGAETSQSGSRSMSIQLTAPPKTHMQFQLVWTGNEQIGIVQNLRGSNLPIAFRGFSPTDVHIKSQNDIGCDSSGDIHIVEETQSTEPSSTTPHSANSISEELVVQLSNGQVSVEEVNICLGKAHEGPTTFISFKKGDEIPSNALVATDYSGGGKTWNEFPVTPLCYSGSWGLFRSNAAYVAPYEGAYWYIIP